MTHVSRCLTVEGVKPIVKYKYAFKNTYLYGCFSPIDGDMLVYEIIGTISQIFYKYLCALSEHRPNEFKIVILKPLFITYFFYSIFFIWLFRPNTTDKSRLYVQYLHFI